MDIHDTPQSRLELTIALIAAGLFLMTALQTYALWHNGVQLKTVHEAQTQPMEQSQKIRAQLDAIAGKTAKLAEQGNPNAKVIIDDLKKQGITVKPTP